MLPISTPASRPNIEPLEARIAPAAVIALDADNHLLRFDSAAPGIVTDTIPLTGLAAGEHLVAIDFRSSTGYLYGLGIIDGPNADDSEARLYAIDLGSGTCFLRGSGPFATGLADGLAWDIDFDPAGDALRAINSAGANLTLDPSTGAATAHTGVEQYIGIAYDRSIPNSVATTLFGIDFANGTLDRIGGVDGGNPEGSPDAGVSTTIGSLGFTLGSRNAGFDISPTGAVFASLVDDALGLTGFYTIDLGSGAATRVGILGTGGPILDIAAVHFAWSGNGNTDAWSNPANWWGSTAPSAGDLLYFSPSTAQPEPVNDYPAGTEFHSLHISREGGYYLSGNAIALTDGIRQFGSNYNSLIALPIKLATSQAFTSDVQKGLTFSRSVGIDLDGHTLTFGGTGAITANGVISSSTAGGSIVKTGPGALAFYANNSYDGTTTVAEGTLSIFGTQPQSEVLVTGGTLSGSVRLAEGLAGAGSVHATGGIVAPGTNGVGALVTQDLTLDAASTFQVTLNFDDLVTLSGRVNVSGTVTLSNAALDLSIPTPLPVGSHITLISNDGVDPVVGTFAGLGANATLTIDGVDYTLSLTGGDGNDVVLSRGAAPTVTLVNSHTATFTDLDGDLVTIRTTRGALTAGMFTLQPAGVFGGAQLELVTLGAGFDRSNLTITAKPQFADGDTLLDGDGFVHIGGIEASGSDLGRVLVRGDLGFINAGNANTKTAGIEQLTVHSMGRFDESTQGPTPTLRSDILGSLGRLNVTTDVFGADIRVSGGAQPKDGAIGSIQIGGSLLGGVGVNASRIYSSGDMGPVSVKGQIYGGAGESSASLVSDGNIRSITVGAGLLGTRGLGSGSINAGGNIGPITIGGDLFAGSGVNSAKITAGGSIAKVTISGSLKGYTGAGSASIQAASIGALQIGGTMEGGAGTGSASIHATGDIRSIAIDGGVTGGKGEGSASIVLGGTLKDLRVGGDIRGGEGKESALVKPAGDLSRLVVFGSIGGGAGLRSGLVEPDGGMRSATLYGSIIGGAGDESGQIYPNTASSIAIAGSVIGGSGAYSGTVAGFDSLGAVFVNGSLVGGTGQYSGNIYGEKSIASVSIRGGIQGARGNDSGSVSSSGAIRSIQVVGEIVGGDGQRSGTISATGDLGKVQVGGSVSGGFGFDSGAIRTDAALKSVTVRGSLVGGVGDRSGAIYAGGMLASADLGGVIGGYGPNTASIVSGTAIGNVTIRHDASGADYSVVIAAPGVAEMDNLAIGRVSIGGVAQDVLILGGANYTSFVNGDARIGDVQVAGDWLVGGISAGVEPGSDGYFGTDDDIAAAGNGASRIASITIGGLVRGSRQNLNANDQFAFTAAEIAKLSVGGFIVPLDPGANNDTDGIPLGATGDFVVRELAAR